MNNRTIQKLANFTAFTVTAMLISGPVEAAHADTSGILNSKKALNGFVSHKQLVERNADILKLIAAASADKDPLGYSQTQFKNTLNTAIGSIVKSPATNANAAFKRELATRLGNPLLAALYAESGYGIEDLTLAKVRTMSRHALIEKLATSPTLPIPENLINAGDNWASIVIDPAYGGREKIDEYQAALPVVIQQLTASMNAPTGFTVPNNEFNTLIMPLRNEINGKRQFPAAAATIRWRLKQGFWQRKIILKRQIRRITRQHLSRHYLGACPFKGTY